VKPIGPVVSLNTNSDLQWNKVFSCLPTNPAGMDASGIDSFVLKDVISVAIVPDSADPAVIAKYAVQTHECNGAVKLMAYSSSGYELSYSIRPGSNYADLQNIDSWYGSSEARNRLRNTCFGNGKIYSIKEKVYHACGNSGGMHVFRPAAGSAQCRWDHASVSVQQPRMDIYFATSKSGRKC
jgi:hypothetical protein